MIAELSRVAIDPRVRKSDRPEWPANGAFSSLPDAPAKVPSPSDLPTFVVSRTANLRPGEPPEGQLHRGEGHERIGSPSLSTEAWIFAAHHLLAGAEPI